MAARLPGAERSGAGGGAEPPPPRGPRRLLARPAACLGALRPRGPVRREEERGKHGGFLLCARRWRRRAQHPRDREAGNKGSAPAPAVLPAPSGDGVPRLRGAQRLRPQEERPVSQRRGGKAELDHGLQVSRRDGPCRAVPCLASPCPAPPRIARGDRSPRPPAALAAGSPA